MEGVEVEKESRSLVRMKEDGWSVAEGFPSLCCLGQDEWWELKEEKEESELVPLFRQK